ncbi:probable CCR4-associated factor 1 homolog 1 [Phragmites australis]|uniref:probable CCR4-associated factor 1 homolog 1 n=1 Tax=Phragmites australis TaxID=29695 RepID=UPI002D794745|nr:probable CCR4-associated factor 1 homolog 1 [Phragmites australis]
MAAPPPPPRPSTAAQTRRPSTAGTPRHSFMAVPPPHLLVPVVPAMTLFMAAPPHHHFPPMISLFSDDIEIVEVWGGEEAQRVAEILALLPHYPFMEIDTEFAESGTFGSPRPLDAEAAYQQIRSRVGRGDMVQLAVAICNEAGEVPGRVWQFNFRIDIATRAYDAGSINFLEQESGIDLELHRRRGINHWYASRTFANLVEHADGCVWWIGFHGGSDVGFLLKILGGGSGLPSGRLNFVNLFGKKFPYFFDVKVIARELKVFGGLKTISDKLKAVRLGGAHQAGSDALLTLRCFFKLMQNFGNDSVMSRYGMLVDINDMTPAIIAANTLTSCYGDVTLVDVRHHNMAAEFSRIKSLCRYYPIVAAEALLPGHLPRLPSPDAESCYTGMCEDLNRADHVKLMLAFANSMGDLALGSIWMFNISRSDALQVPSSGGEADQCVSPAQFSSFLGSCGLLLSPQVTWVTFRGAYTAGILIKTEFHSHSMPPKFEYYIPVRNVYLPNLFDIAVLSHGFSDAWGCQSSCAAASRRRS